VFVLVAEGDVLDVDEDLVRALLVPYLTSHISGIDLINLQQWSTLYQDINRSPAEPSGRRA
jgi:hypothetical protein